MGLPSFAATGLAVYISSTCIALSQKTIVKQMIFRLDLLLAKHKVDGSKPFTRSNKTPTNTRLFLDSAFGIRQAKTDTSLFWRLLAGGHGGQVCSTKNIWAGERPKGLPAKRMTGPELMSDSPSGRARASPNIEMGIA